MDRSAAAQPVLDFLRSQRTATAIPPYSARARSGMPVAAPIAWDELDILERSDTLSIGDVESLLERAKSRKLKRWGFATQGPPSLDKKTAAPRRGRTNGRSK